MDLINIISFNLILTFIIILNKLNKNIQMESIEESQKGNKLLQKISIKQLQKINEPIEEQLFPDKRTSSKKLPMIIEENDNQDMAKYKEEFNNMFEKFTIGILLIYLL